MGWAKFDDRYINHPKILDAGPLAELLDVRAIIYSAGAETDGYISRGAFDRIAHGIAKPLSRAMTLVEVGRWSPCDGGGWQIHDFLEYNVSREQAARWREQGAERQRRSRSRRDSRPGQLEHDPSVTRDDTGDFARPVPVPVPLRDPSGGSNGAEAPSTPLEKRTITEQVPALVAGYVADYRATHNGVDPAKNWRGQAGKAARMALADGVDPSAIAVCLGVIATESKQPSVLQHVLADYHADHPT